MSEISTAAAAVIDPDPGLVDRLAAQIADGDMRGVTELFADNGVAAPTVAWSPAAGATATPSFDFLTDYWETRRAGRAMPGEADIDPIGLRPALGRLLVCEPTRCATDFRIRLYGSRLALEMGRDLTGTFISDFQPGAYVTDFFLACYRAVTLRRAPLYTRHVPSAASFASDIKRLLLPFGSGAEVARIVTGIETVTRRPLGRPPWARRL